MQNEPVVRVQRILGRDDAKQIFFDGQRRLSV
jgi:hypothetical protein